MKKENTVPSETEIRQSFLPQKVLTCVKLGETLANPHVPDALKPNIKSWQYKIKGQLSDTEKETLFHYDSWLQDQAMQERGRRRERE